jgi:hypothetical protein
MGDQPDARPLPTHRITQTQKNAGKHPCREWNSQHSRRAKTFHASDSAVTVIVSEGYGKPLYCLKLQDAEKLGR